MIDRIPPLQTSYLPPPMSHGTMLWDERRRGGLCWRLWWRTWRAPYHLSWPLVVSWILRPRDVTVKVAKSTRSTRVKIDSFVEDNAKTNGNNPQTTTNTMMMVGRMSVVDKRILKIRRTLQQTISSLIPLEPMSCLNVRLIFDHSFIYSQWTT